jgi:hypothetical protein
MKKIFFVLLIVFGIQIDANAQVYSSNDKAQQAASEDLVMLSRTSDINDENLLKELHLLFTNKHLALSDKKITSDKKAEIINAIELKIKANFSSEIINNLKKQNLYKVLLNDENFRNPKTN